MDAVSDFLHYQLAQAEARVAFERYSGASSQLENCRIRERAAELRSQSIESIAKGGLAKAVGEINDHERSIALAFVRYVVYGRTD